MLSPKAQDPFKQTAVGLIQEVGNMIRPHIMSAWGVPEVDIGISGAYLAYTENEADIQVEIRYTAGEKEYGREAVFRPTKEQQEELYQLIDPGIAKIGIRYHCGVSVWMIPYEGGTFKPG